MLHTDGMFGTLSQRLRATRAVVLLATIGLGLLATAARADDSKIEKEGVFVDSREVPAVKNKECCGYPLSENLGFALRFYWLAQESRFEEAWEDPEIDVYTPKGYFLGRYPIPFVDALRMEGSGLLSDGRVINYAGRCRYGVGTCFEELDVREHPFGRGAGRRPLIPFKSVAVDPRIIPIGEPLYIPEFDGIELPDGTVHDGCVRADDTGGGIKKRKMDFFVVTYGNFRTLLNELWGVIWITPHIESPRCQYLRQPR